MDRERDFSDRRTVDSATLNQPDDVDVEEPGHADTGTAAGVGGVTGAAIGAAAGPVGAAIGAIGGMILGAATERIMHGGHDEPIEDDADTSVIEQQH